MVKQWKNYIHFDCVKTVPENEYTRWHLRFAGLWKCVLEKKVCNIPIIWKGPHHLNNFPQL